MTTQVKICGINSVAAFDTAMEEGADFIGFVFFTGSPRCVTPAQAAALSLRRAGGPLRVGLFVDPTEAAIADVLRAVPLDALQLYGLFDLPALHARFRLPIWRAVGVATPADLPTEARGADRLLIEAKAPPGASRPGGNAQTFDWSMLRGWTAPCVWMLAGGLNPENVAHAIRTTGAPSVDVSSGIESAPGVKDPARIRAFVAAARSV